MRTKYSFGGRGYDQRRRADVDTTKLQTSIGSNNISNSVINGNVTTNVGTKRLSYIVYNPETKEWFDSQADTSRKTGHSESDISKHLNHGRRLSDGMVLERKGVAT